MSSHIGLRLGLSSGLFYCFPSKILYAFIISPLRATWLNLFDLITLIIIFVEEYKLW